MQKWFEVHVSSAGYIREHSVTKREGGFITKTGETTYGFSVEERPEPRFQRDLARTVFVCEDGVFASAEVLGALLETQYLYGPHFKFGRRKMWQITEELIIEAMRINEYERRSEREREVQRRNDALISWFLTLAGL